MRPERATTPATGTSWSRRRRALTVVALIVLAACSRAGSGGAGGEGSKALPTGPPVVIGFINQEDAPVGSFPEVRRGVQSAVDYVNTELGGVGGRPVRIETCLTRGTPESSQACATRLVAAKPVAVLGGVDFAAQASLPVLAKARIAYVGGSPTLGDELTAPNAFMLAGGTVTDLLGQAQYALTTLGAKKIGALYVDLPGALSTVLAAAPLVLRSRGATDVKLVAERADAADFVPALKGVNANSPDVILVVFPAQSCARIMAGAQALAVKAAMFYPGACASKAVTNAAGAAANGAYFASGFLPFDDRSNEVATWKRAAADESVLSQAGFATLMNLRQILAELAEADGGADKLSPTAVAGRLKATRDQPAFMAHPYSCDAKQVPFLSAVCNPYVRILRYGSGRFSDVGGDWVNGAELVKGFGG